LNIGTATSPGVKGKLIVFCFFLASLLPVHPLASTEFDWSRAYTCSVLDGTASRYRVTGYYPVRHGRNEAFLQLDDLEAALLRCLARLGLRRRRLVEMNLKRVC
jgi:hypothetical protein